MPFNLFILGTDIKANNPSCAAGRLVEARKHVHSGGLSGSVSTEETKDFALLHCKGDVVYSME